MSSLLSFLPATVFAAVALFLTKEALEFSRRWRAEERKKLAIQTPLAVECERNHWALKSFRIILNEMKNNVGNTQVLKDANGKALFRISNLNGGWMQKPIPDVYKYYIDKYIMDAASLDSKIFLKMMQAYDALLEIKHVRSGVINYIQPFDENNADIVQGFVEYAIEEIDDVYESISGLYRECVGKQLDVHRYR